MEKFTLLKRLAEIEGRIISTGNIIATLNSDIQKHMANYQSLLGCKQEIEYWVEELNKLIEHPEIGNQ